MKRTCEDYNKNILIVNANKKFTFLNTEKRPCLIEIIEKGIIKMRREYGYKWGEDDERNFTIAYVI